MATGRGRTEDCETKGMLLKRLTPHGIRESFTRSWRWWLGVPLISFIVAVIPYWVLNLLHVRALTAPWWRIPVATPGVFDTYVYLNFLGTAAQGLPYGGRPLGWYAAIIESVWPFMSSWASIPEVWIATRWLSFALLILMGSWSIRRWSSLDRKTSWAIIFAYALAVALSIGLRPGAYSWYLPFAFFAITAVSVTWESLDRTRIAAAAGWSAAALALASGYPWYLVFVALWLASIWTAAVIRWRPKIFYGLAACTVTAIGIVSIPMARWFLAPAQSAFIGLYERSGIAFTRLPFFSNTLLAFGAWIVLLASLAYVFRSSDILQKRLMRDIWAWIVLIALWFSTSVTGILLMPDHLITVTFILAWLSMATVWSCVREVSGVEREALPAVIRIAFIALAVCASLFIAYIIQQPLRSNPFLFDSYAIHVIHWLALAVACWLCVIRLIARWKVRSGYLFFVLYFCCCVIAGWGIISVIARDSGKLEGAMSRVQVISRIRAMIPPIETVCADPKTAPFFAAHTGLRIYPTEAMLSYSVTNEYLLHVIETLAGAYDVQASGSTSNYHFYTDHFRLTMLSRNVFWPALLSRFGATTSTVNRLYGFRQDVVDKNWLRISSAVERHELDEQAFREICPWVIIPDDQKSYWQIPKSYKEIRIDERTSVWRAE